MALFRSLCCLLLGAAALLASTPDVAINGTVIDGKDPLQGVNVSLASDPTIADTTGADGKFELATATGVLGPSDLHVKNEVRTGIRGTSLSFTLSHIVASGEIALFNGNGCKVMQLSLNNLTAETHHVALPQLSSGFYVLSMRFGGTAINRELISMGSALYLDRPGALFSGKNGGSRKKQALAGVDSLQVEKEGYNTKTVALASFQVENLEIALEKEGSGSCHTTTDVTVKGPFETVAENVDGAILYRPKDLLDGCLYPVVTWGHGYGGKPSDYNNLCHILASHGFVVIGTSAKDVQTGGTKENQFRNEMVKVAAWVVEQNDISSSVFYNKIATDKVGASGHSQGGYGATEAGQNPLITTSVSSCGAVGSDNLKGPALILCAGNDHYDGSRCGGHPEDAYNGISNMSVMKAEYHNADHMWCMDMGASSSADKPHDMLKAMTAWFRYHLMDDQEYKSWFYGDDCELCKSSDWNVKSKKMD